MSVENKLFDLYLVLRCSDVGPYDVCVILLEGATVLGDVATLGLVSLYRSSFSFVKVTFVARVYLNQHHVSLLSPGLKTFHVYHCIVACLFLNMLLSCRSGLTFIGRHVGF